MIKKILIGVGAVILLFVLFVVNELFIKTPASPAAVATYSQNGLDMSVTYSQPSKKGRLIYGEESAEALVPYGVYWRLGANEATQITFSKDVTFGGESVTAGTYRMYAVPGKDAFKVTLNTETDVFFGISEPDYDMDVVTVNAPVQGLSSEVEMFTIDFGTDSIASVNFSWDKTMFSVPVQ